MKFKYPAKIILDNSERYFVQFIDIDEAITEGETLEEAIFNAQEVLTLSLEGRLDENMEIPLPSTSKENDIYYVAPSASLQAVLLIHESRKNKISMAEFARIMQTSWPSASKLEKPHNSPHLKTIEKAASALGKRLILSFE
jgi:antitoxin HicB